MLMFIGNILKPLLNYTAIRLYILCLAYLFFGFSTKAQQTGSNFQDQLFKYNSETQAVRKLHPAYYIVQLKQGTCLNAIQENLARKLNDQQVIVRRAFLAASPTTNNCIQRYAPANDNWKLSPSLEEQQTILRKKNNITVRFTVVADNIDSLLRNFTLQKLNWKLVTMHRASNAAVIQCAPQQFFSTCLPDPRLIFADKFVAATSDSYVTGYRRNFNTINLTDHLLPAANGQDIVIGIKEKMMDATDMDLQKRILPSTIASSEKEYHATTIATLAGGAGNSFYTGKGVASHCTFFPSTFGNLFPDSSNLLLQKKVTVQNHSYGTVIQSFYGAEAAAYDAQLAQDNKLVHVFSSGNMGLSAPTTGTYASQPGYANITGNFKMAKNIITVAATDTGGNLAAFSSAGPLFDGRLAPQLTALGPNGTSEAAAIVSGAAAVLQQVYKDSNAQEVPCASLIKALLFTTADDIGNKGIDYKSGYGLINIYGALNALMQRHYTGSQLRQGENWTRTITVPSMAANLKVTLVWTDTAASVNTNRALVNDLDLELRHATSGELYLPWMLNSYPHRDSLNKLPVRQRDSLNTAEQVSLEAPPPGNYTITVRARKIQTMAPQSFHIAYKWDTLHRLKFTNPVQASDLDRDEIPVLRVQWSVALADTNSSGRLFVSYNGGTDWIMINSSVPLNKQFAHWPLPDTTSQAQLKMECAFGDFYSERFMIAPVTKLKIDYRCPDSLRISWRKYPGASAYQLFALVDSAYLKPVKMLADSFAVLKPATDPATTYAVEPIFSNGLRAARSIAVDVRNQGVQCFYKTLLAEQRGDSIELSLSLSFPAAVQQVSFEKLGNSGTRGASIAELGPSGVSLINTVFDPSPAAGMNFYRASLVTAAGILYTETVGVFHNGDQPLVVFPNPVPRGMPLQFRAKGVLGNANLLIADMTGRRVAQFTINTAHQIKTHTLPCGVYAYKLTSSSGVTITSGKIIIQ